jgi:hypothetical protein
LGIFCPASYEYQATTTGIKPCSKEELRRVGVESSAKVTVNSGEPRSKVGGLGGNLVSGAQLKDSYTRAGISCVGENSFSIGKILAYTDNSVLGPGNTQVKVERVYAEVDHLGDCTSPGYPIGQVAADAGPNPPDLSSIHVTLTNVGNEMYVFGANPSNSNAVTTYNQGGLNNVQFSGWDFTNIWNLLTDRPPTLRK